MSEPGFSSYRRLPGRPAILRQLLGLSSALWLGDDHLIEREMTFVSERYRRFAYGDIQALLLRETPRGLVISVVLGVFAAGSGLLAWSNEDNFAVHAWFGGIGAFWLALLAVNALRGRTCRCRLQTAAGPHVLRSLSRVRPTRRAWRLILKKVDAAQGEPSADAVREVR